jgi:hypothetical protein
LSGCQEAWDDFGWQSMGNFLRYGNIPIVATLNAEIMLVVYPDEFGGASLVHFPRRMSRRSFPGRTFLFPAKKAQDEHREVLGGALALGGRHSINTYNNQMEVGVWGGGYI